MEDLIDIRNRREQCNVIKWYNVNYQPASIEDKQSDEELQKDMSISDESENVALEILARINKAQEDKVLAAIEDGKKE